MLNKKLSLQAVPMKLHVKKDKKGFYAVLEYSDGKATLEVNNIKEKDLIDYDISDKENEVIDVVVNGKDILIKDKVIATLANIFAPKTLLKLVSLRFTKRENLKNKAGIYMGKRLLSQLDLSELPAGLFDRREVFDLSVIDDEHFMIVRYANLHQHTEFSLLDGIVKINELAEVAENACAITDHGNMSGVLKFYNAMKKKHKTPILGVEAYVETLNGPRLTLKNADSSVFESMFDNTKEETALAGEHLILLAKNETGLKNLYWLVSDAENHYKRKPHVTYESLSSHSEGIIATSACIAGTLSRAQGECLACQERSEDLSKKIKQYGEYFYQNEDLIDKSSEVECVYIYNHKLREDFVDRMVEIFGKDDFYIEIQNHHFELEDKIMKELVKFARSKGIKLTVGIDAHYLRKEDKDIHEMWLCLQTKKVMSDPKRMRFSGDGYYVHNSDEVVELFKDIPDALDNTLEIAEKCSFEMVNEGYHLPVFPVPEGFKDQTEYFLYLCRRRYKERFLDTPKYKDPVYLERMKFEIDTILRMGWPGYFLIVQDFIRYAKDTEVAKHLDEYFPANRYDQSVIPDAIKKDYEIYIGPGRGSAAGSLVCYCLGITDIDPIEYDLLFERFLSPDRVSMPDIDTDLEDSLREKVIDYVKYKYGPDHVSRIITFGTAAAKASIKDAFRINEQPVKVAQQVADTIPDRPGITLKDALEESVEFKALYDNDATIHQMVDVAMKFEGLKKNRGQHACGILITPEPVCSYMPQCLLVNKDTGMAEPTAGFTMSECEDQGCLKMDFLGLRTLGVAHNTVKLLEGKADIDYNDLPINDIKVYDFIKDGNTSGVFQFESSHMTDIIKKMYQDLDDKEEEIAMLPDGQREAKSKELAMSCFNKMCDATALGRPGPMEEIPHYIECMMNPDEIVYQDERMRQDLDVTYSIMVYQEQVMNLVKHMAGFTAGQADTVRKGMAKKKKEILDEYKEYFINGSKEKGIKGCVANGISKEAATDIWNKMEKFGLYAFNRSHSVSYSYHSARTAWLSYYYPAEYFCAILNSYISNKDEIRKYISDVQSRGIKVHGPSVNESDEEFTVSSDGSIRFGLRGIKDVGSSSVNIIKERKANGRFTSLADFIQRMGTSAYGKVDSSSIMALISAGALDEFGNTRKSMIDGFDEIKARMAIISETVGNNRFRNFAKMIGAVPSDVLAPWKGLSKKEKEMPVQDMAILEHKYTGFFISDNPIKGYRKDLSKIKLDSFKIKEKFLTKEIKKKKVKLAGVITDIELLQSKKDGKTFAKFTLEGTDGTVEAVAFTSAYEMYRDLIKEYQVVVLEGTMRADDFGVSLMATSISTVEQVSVNKKIQKITITTISNKTKANISQLKPFLTKKGSTDIFLKDIRGEKLLKSGVAIDLEQLEMMYNLFGSQNCKVVYE